MPTLAASLQHVSMSGNTPVWGIPGCIPIWHTMIYNALLHTPMRYTCHGHSTIRDELHLCLAFFQLYDVVINQEFISHDYKNWKPRENMNKLMKLGVE